MFAKYGHYLILFLIFIAIFYASGSSIEWDQMPAVKPRVLALFTQVPDGFVKVVDVLDGDTIVVLENGKEETVRLLGVDTPETRDPRRPVQCFGKEASDFTKNLLVGRAVRMELDPTEANRDKYNRLLRYVYLEDKSMLNERLVYDGYAFAYEAYPTQKLEVLKEMEAQAKKYNRGLWGGCETTIKNGGKSKSTNPVKP